MSAIDPITLELRRQRLVTIVDEMDTSTTRTSFSSMVTAAAAREIYGAEVNE